MTEPEGSKRYSWVVRDGDEQPWTLLTYRWTSRKDALDTAEHWEHHYRQVKTVEVDGENWKVIDDLTGPVYKEFRVSAAGFADNGIWVTVVHTPCGQAVFGGEEDPDATDVAEMVFLVQAHRCSG